MLSIMRHLLAILLLPFIMVIVVPTLLSIWLASYDSYWYETSFLATLGDILGILTVLSGLGLFVWCVALFARIGQGTLAPWDPTRKLVAVGPYRHVRNPMIAVWG